MKLKLLILFVWGAFGFQSVTAELTGTIAFLSNRDSKPPHRGRSTSVYLINADGTNERKWLENPDGLGKVAWSPDGKFVALSQYNDRGESNLFVLEFRTGKQENITKQWHKLEMDFFSPTWSGDGRRLALVCSPRGELPPSICTIRMDGDGLKQITNAFHENNHEHSNPSWSPNQEKIAFTVGDVDKKKRGIFVIDRNGENRVLLSRKGSKPVWSPDGTKIAFYSNLHNIAQQDIYVMNADGANIVRLTDDPAPDRLPAWSPDGQWVAFMSFVDKTEWDIYIVDANGGDKIQVTTHPDSDTRPTWVIPDRSLPVDTRSKRVTFWGQLKSEKR